MYILNKFFVVSTNNLQIDKRCIHEEFAKLQLECDKAFIRSTSGSSYIMHVV